MVKFAFTLLGVALFLILGAGCTPRHTVILVADPDGYVGKAEVSTDGGKQLLEKSQEMTTISGRSSAPTPVTQASQEYITATFAEVLAIEPPPAEKFIIYFHPGTTDVVSESLSTIDTIVSAVKRRGAVSISISGHTDSTGTVQFNKDLSHDRAKAISKLLIQQGVDESIMTVSSHGKGNQLVPTADGIPEPRNRRVEVIVR